MLMSVAGNALRVRVASLTRAVRTAPEVVVLLLLAAIVRLALLGAQSGWSDEATTLQVAQAGWRGLVLMQAHDTHPLLYFVLLRAWLLVTGFGLLRARLFSTVCDVATIAALYSLASRLFGRPTAIVTSTLFALSPVAVWYAATARMYALTELLTLLTIRMLVEAYLTQRTRYWAAFGVCGGLAINADYSGVYLVGAGAIWYLLSATRRRARLQPLLRSIGIMVVLLIPAVALVFRQVFGAGLGLSQIGWIPTPTPARVWGTLSDLISQQAQGAAVAVVGGALILCAAGVCSRDARRPTHRAYYLLLACMILAPLALALLMSVIRPVFITRQVITALFGLLIVFGRTIVLLWGRWRPIAVLALGALVTLNATSLRVMADTQLTEDWQHTALYVLDHSSGRTLLVFNPYFFDKPFFLYTGPTANLADDWYASPTATLTVDWPPLAPPPPTYSTVWLIDVYPPGRPSLPTGWSARRMALGDEHRFANIALFRVVRH